MTVEAARDRKEGIQIKGKLVVITGPSGSGKDSVYEELLKIGIGELGFNWITTCATREPRTNKKTNKMEVDGVDYHFITEAELFRMHEKGDLAEKPVKTGTSWKATSRKALTDALSTNHALWRVDLSLAADIEQGGEFISRFEEKTAQVLSKSIMVIYIDVDPEILTQRRLERIKLSTPEEIKRHEEEYAERDKQEMDIVMRSSEIFKVRVPNPQNELEKTATKVYEMIQRFITE